MFTDMGLSPQNQQLALLAITNRSLQQVRTQYESEVVKAYEQGIVSDAELDQVFDALGWSNEARQLAKSRAILARRETLGKEVETQVKSLVSAGLMDGQTGLQNLEAAGVQPWKAELVVTLAETVATVRAAKAELKAEQAIAIKEQRNIARTLLLQFEQGIIDLAALAAGLIAAGVDPTLVTTMTSLAETQRNGPRSMAVGQASAAGGGEAVAREGHSDWRSGEEATNHMATRRRGIGRPGHNTARFECHPSAMGGHDRGRQQTWRTTRRAYRAAAAAATTRVKF